jgi:hypothetical protein
MLNSIAFFAIARNFTTLYTQKSQQLMRQKLLELIGTFPDDGKNEFRRRMRFHQGWWRTFVLGKEEGTYIDPNKIERGNCSKLKPEDGAKGLNFINEDTFNIAQTYSAIQDKLIEVSRLNENLLSSQPTAFNFFAQLSLDCRNESGLANRFLKILIPDITNVSSVDFECNPKNRIDKSAFDFGFQIEINGKKGFAGYECKLTDEFSWRDKTGKFYGEEGTSGYNRYFPVYERHRNHFIDDYFSYVKSKEFNQLFRNELMAKNMEENKEYEFVFTGLFCHNDDKPTVDAGKRFVEKLGDGQRKFRTFTHSEFFEIMGQLTLTPMQQFWLRMLRVRYSPEFSNEIYKICFPVIQPAK